MRFYIKSVEELIEFIEGLAQKSRDGIGKTRTKLESNELKGQVYAYNEVLFYIKEYQKTQKEMANGSSSQMESLDSSSHPDSNSSGESSPQPLGRKIAG